MTFLIYNNFCFYLLSLFNLCLLTFCQDLSKVKLQVDPNFEDEDIKEKPSKKKSKNKFKKEDLVETIEEENDKIAESDNDKEVKSSKKPKEKV